LETVLVNFTRRINLVLKEIRDTIMVDHKVIDSNFKIQSEQLEDKDFTLENVQLLLQHITSHLDAIINKSATDRKIPDSYKITKDNLKHLLTQDPWLFDAVELRSYFFENSKLYKNK
jgi:hypothetical protein